MVNIPWFIGFQHVSTIRTWWCHGFFLMHSRSKHPQGFCSLSLGAGSATSHTLMYSNMAAWKIPGWFGDFPGIAYVWGRQTGPEGISHYVKLYPTTSHYVNGGFLKWGTWVSILKCSSDLDDLGYLGVPWLRNPPNISHYIYIHTHHYNDGKGKLQVLQTDFLKIAVLKDGSLLVALQSVQS